MALGSRHSRNTGNFLSIVMVNAVNNSITAPSTNGGGNLVIPQPWKTAVDMENAKQMWISFPKNEPPKIARFDSELFNDGRPEDPSFKEGFEVLTFTNKKVGNELIGLRRYRANGRSHRDAIWDLHNEWMEKKDSNGNKIPIVECQPEAIVYDTSPNQYWIPMMKIVDWIERDKIPGFDESSVKSWEDGIENDVRKYESQNKSPEYRQESVKKQILDDADEAFSLESATEVAVSDEGDPSVPF